jgi:hypothetical protein
VPYSTAGVSRRGCFPLLLLVSPLPPPGPSLFLVFRGGGGGGNLRDFDNGSVSTRTLPA